MLRIRIVSAAAAAAIATALAANGAAAQIASADQTGKPLSLLQLVPHATTPAAQADSAGSKPKRVKFRKAARKKHNAIATAQDSNSPADSAQSTASADAWLAASATPANATPATATSASATSASAIWANPATPSAGAAWPAPTGNAAAENPASSVVIGGQTVQIADAGQINDIDLAAGNTPPMESTLPPTDRADFAPADPAPASQVAFVAPASSAPDEDDEDTRTQDASAQNASAQDVSAVGSAAWIAQVLAALGGAIAAGTVAWLLIGAGPQVQDYS